MSDALRSFLADRDEPCPNCGYNLRGLQGAMCPECKLELSLSLQVTPYRQGLYTATLLGMTAGASFCLLWCGVLGYGRLDRLSYHASELLVLAGCGLVLATVVGLLVLWRARFLRQPLYLQWMFVMLAGISLVVAVTMVIDTL